jgi:hypothetical protein
MRISREIHLTGFIGYTDRVILIIARAIDVKNKRAPGGAVRREPGIKGIAAAVFSA